jgi:hypothetical protein
MVFWIAILVGAVFVWLAVRMGFYQSWGLLFNIVISIYLAIFLAPLVADWAPTTGGGAGYGIMLSLIALAGGCFAILYGLSYVFLTGQFSIPFPKVLDILVAGSFGFLSGFLIWSFVALVVTASPLAQHKVLSTLGFNRQAQKANIACMAWCCDVVHSVARFEPAENATVKAIDHLIEKAESVSQSAGDEPNGAPQAAVPAPSPRLPLDEF